MNAERKAFYEYHAALMKLWTPCCCCLHRCAGRRATLDGTVLVWAGRHRYWTIVSSWR